MSSNFHSVLVEDNIISQITDEVTFAVQSSGQECYQQFASTSVSTSNITFNAQIPSQEVVLDRNMLLSSNVNFTVNVGQSGTYATAFAALATDGTGVFFDYGNTEAFGPYPMNSLITTVSGTINNVSVNSQTQDTLATLLRLNDAPLISETNTSTATLPDFYYASYGDAVINDFSSSNNPLGNVLQSSFDAVYFGRGTVPAKIAIIQYDAAGNAVPDSNKKYRVPTAVRAIVEVNVLLVEPLMTLSPFVNNASGTSAGLYGINQISLNINVDSNCRRFFRTARVLGDTAPALSPQGFYTPTFIQSITLGTAGFTSAYGASGIVANNAGFSNCQLLSRFLTLQPSQVLKLKSSRNSVSYTETPRYLTLQGSQSAVTSRFAPGADPHQPQTTQVITSNLQLSLIPDKIVVCARIPMSQQSYGNSDSFYTIQSATVLFNSASGLISSATLTDIYKLSRRNGSSQNFFEFFGMASRNGADKNEMVGTIGSILIIDPVKDLSLPEYLSNSSSGSFNLQIQLNIVCNYGYSANNSTYPVEIMTTTVNSGIFTCQSGVCSSEVGVLNKEVVLNTKMNTAPESIMMQSEYERLIGGRRHQMSRFNNPALMSHKRNNSMYQPRMHMGSGVSGGGVSGGVMSGGVMSGGRLSRHIR
jgi:hypothetical protein